MIRRYSSRRDGALGASFLAQRLTGAASYDRLAGYFCSSMLEVAGEAMESLAGKARILCNSGVSAEDVKVATLADNKQKVEWADFKPEEKYSSPESCARLLKLHALLSSGKVEIRVLPDEVYGLMHGKAGVIRRADGSATSFVGSMNETKSAFALNYEIVWEDDGADAVAWTQSEFDRFWNDPRAVPLAQFIVKDLERLGRRRVVPVEDWRKTAGGKPEEAVATAIAEEPVVRREYGLWDHQKAFVLRAFQEHASAEGARLVLADMVGLGKTLQLAAVAKLVAMTDGKPVLILCPKTLLQQWQDEFLEKLDCPTALWTGRNWRCKIDGETFEEGPDDILACPRRIGIVSQGLVTRGGDTAAKLLERSGGWSLVIVDEAHRARRQNLQKDPDTNRAQPNKLLRFLWELSRRTHSILLATATPVQLHPIEAYDLLTALSGPGFAAQHVLGDEHSRWNARPATALSWVAGEASPSGGEDTPWQVMRNPMPAPEIHGTEAEWTNGAQDIDRFRKHLRMRPDAFVLSQAEYDRYPQPEKDLLRRIWATDHFVAHQNPYVRSIVRRTRDWLETTVNPVTGLPYLQRIEVVLHGETPEESLPLQGYFADAYRTAEEFCKLLSSRATAGGFLKTMLLKRIGSTMLAGEATARKMLAWAEPEGAASATEPPDDDEEDDDETDVSEDVRDLTSAETDLLRRLVALLEQNRDEDPKYRRIVEILRDGADGEGGWASRGCILFSQYFDSARAVAERLSLDFPGVAVGLYAGGAKSGVFRGGVFAPQEKDKIKTDVKNGALTLLVGTDAASEGLNLQRLGTLINIDLPWNPTRLEQRKGRIQRIGQVSPKVDIYNLRYRGSVEDRVHERLSDRLEEIRNIFGQIPDTLDDVWIHEALGEKEAAEAAIRKLPRKNPFAAAYETGIPPLDDWEACATVLDRAEMQSILRQPW